MTMTRQKFVRTPSAAVIGARPAPPPRPTARGTRRDQQLGPGQSGCLIEHQVGVEWHFSLRLEYLGRNLATAAGLEFAYRLGRAHDEFEALGRLGRRAE